MKTKRFVKLTAARILSLGCAGFICLGGSYTWTEGAHPTHDWDNPYNWSGGTSIPPIEFPDDANDDALVPTLSSGQWSVRLVLNGSGAYVIDDLRIEGSVNILANAGENPILTTDTVTIKGGLTTETRVLIPFDGDGAKIEAGSCG